MTPYSTLRHDHVRHIVETFVHENFEKIAVGGVEVDGWREVRILQENCESIVAAETRACQRACCSLCPRTPRPSC